uniref:hypothetical protein n=1 Tax=Citrobacter braakii TaxID=57706 RepID=UPI00234307FB|nr:hypothetical protein [Citrobacter braakii]
MIPFGLYRAARRYDVSGGHSSGCAALRGDEMAGIFCGIGSPLSSAGADLKSMKPITKLIVVNNKSLVNRSLMTCDYYIEREKPQSPTPHSGRS